MQDEQDFAESELALEDDVSAADEVDVATLPDEAEDVADGRSDETDEGEDLLDEIDEFDEEEDFSGDVAENGASD
ncbi:MAG TPA: hypothetical protein VF260_10635 [Bacilli bacterium]